MSLSTSIEAKFQKVTAVKSIKAPSSVQSTEGLQMQWPDFNELGDLPVGIHQAKLTEVVEHFGSGSEQREAATRNLQRIYALAYATGCLQRFIIFGSYVTVKPDPRDVDVFLVMRGGFQPSEALLEAQSLFRHGSAQAEFGASLFWVNAGTSFTDVEDLIIGWQTRRDLRRRGIVEVVEP